MIEWHNMRDKMPERHVDVLVCCAYSDYTEVRVANIDEQDVGVYDPVTGREGYVSELQWWDTDGAVWEASSDDYWAYINLPKKDGVSD